MSGKQIIQLAKRNAIVRWFPSNKIEMLHFTNLNTRVHAMNLLTMKSHPLNFRNRINWNCVEVQHSELISMKDLM